MIITSTMNSSPSILGSLRALTPRYQLDFDSAKQLAERQAGRLLELLNVGQDGVQEHHLVDLPHTQVVYEPLSTSGLSYWNGQSWIIVLNQDDSPVRQRFTLLHEYKHIVDHGASARLYRSDWEAERAADYFAGCALIPKRDLKHAWCNLTQRLDQLATYFDVSQQAVRVRLEQTGLIDRTGLARERCARPISTPSWQEQGFRPVTMSGGAR
ncbi:ImmA/IrrE family metallo-endopeptidase [Luteipulveratus mongoliensis]|uniref:IrrE N-terminal-like domain-containing protein n=1 Tax=Luteipulveratus mongoliensis TaxID=571913 RepID=A0A0K1JNM3_9MICO|nr:ImmA/IrrE family metallo-endopeptidase [Luteipulveratus mongoliensis]AKU18185.1 hypothetical protein VV02_23935 [Luteipulveratus mongoliensis]